MMKKYPANPRMPAVHPPSSLTLQPPATYKMIEISRNSHQSLPPLLSGQLRRHTLTIRMDFKILAALLLTFAIAEASVIREEDAKFSAFLG